MLAITDRTDVEVLVVGGGSAGVCAALQAASAGASCLLVDAGPQLGGTTTTGGVSFPGLFHAWERQIIDGFGWELSREAALLSGQALPDFATPPERHWQRQVRFNPAVFAALAEERCVAAGVAIGLYESVLAVAAEATGWRVITAGKGLVREARCRQLVDCSGDAAAVALAEFPRQREAVTQPGTLHYQLCGVAVEALDEPAVEARYRQALADGELLPGDVADPRQPFTAALRGSIKHVHGADGSTARRHTETNLRARASLLRMLRFVRSLPGGEQAQVVEVATECAIRETYRIVGEATVGVDDYRTGRLWDDAVCYAFYPIDLHDTQGVRPDPLARGVTPTVPLRALLPAGSRNLLAAGRCLASDRLANSALRVQATCMATGQAAGAAAALAVAGGCSPGEVERDALARLLTEHRAIVPPAPPRPV